MEDSKLKKTFTVQGFGYPVPVQNVGVEAGPTGSSTSDCGSLLVGNQAGEKTFATGTPSSSRKSSVSAIGSPSRTLPSLESRGGMLFQPLQLGQMFDYSIEDQLKNLHYQLAIMKKENDELRQIIAELKPQETYSPANSDEEEELVARETAWLLPRNKKRKMARSPEKPIEKTEKNQNEKSKQTMSRKQKPPPIVISNLVNYSEMNQTLKKSNFNYKTNMLNNNQLKVNVESETEYRDLTKMLNETSVEWHSYENKQTRPIRVMARGLHPTCEVQDIKEDLHNMGFKIIDVTNKIKKTKRNEKDVIIPLPLFMLSFEHTEDVKKIYQIRYLCNMKVTIESLKSNKLLPQCRRCQRYGHTQRFCQRQPACVKCAGKHLTAECTKPKSAAAKCYNCGEQHPANYRGCIVAKELQKRRDNMNKVKHVITQPRKFHSNKVNNEMTYSQVTQGKQSLPKENNEQQSLMQMMQQMMKTIETLSVRLGRLEARNSGAIPKGTA